MTINIGAISGKVKNWFDWTPIAVSGPVEYFYTHDKNSPMELLGYNLFVSYRYHAPRSMLFQVYSKTDNGRDRAYFRALRYKMKMLRQIDAAQPAAPVPELTAARAQIEAMELFGYRFYNVSAAYSTVKDVSYSVPVLCAYYGEKPRIKIFHFAKSEKYPEPLTAANEFYAEMLKMVEKHKAPSIAR